MQEFMEINQTLDTAYKQLESKQQQQPGQQPSTGHTEGHLTTGGTGDDEADFRGSSYWKAVMAEETIKTGYRLLKGLIPIYMIYIYRERESTQIILKF